MLFYDLVPWWISDLSDPQPVSEVSSIGQSCGQTDHSDTPRGVGGDEVCPGHNDLQHWTPVLTWSDTITSVNQNVYVAKRMFQCPHTGMGILMENVLMEIALCVLNASYFSYYFQSYSA